MSYELHGLIGARAVVAGAATRLRAPVVDLAQGFALVPGPLVPAGAVAGDGAPAGSWPHGEPFWHLAATWEAAAVAASAQGPIAYVEAEFYGGVGSHAAVVWRDGVAVLGPVRSVSPPPELLRSRPPRSIDDALQVLGVRPGERGDEFDALGLGRHRETSSWVTVQAAG